VDEIYVHEAEASEEDGVLRRLRNSVAHLGCSMRRIWGNTLYHIDDLPFDPRGEGFPPTASAFRNAAEKKSTIRAPLPVPQKLKPQPSTLASQSESEDLPTLSDLVGEEVASKYTENTNGVLPFRGGETAGLARLKNYFFDKDCLKDYFHTRNGMVGADYSSKFSPWLACGSLSPRLICDQVRRYEAQRVKNKDTYWMIFELTFRDYFRYYALNWGSAIFHLHGPKAIVRRGEKKSWSADMQLFEKWRLGKTGNPMIDANMRELLQTGFMSNRGRQIVASYLTRDMGLDWRLGAMHFESYLIDHDVCSNYGNWTYSAGVGSDPREDRYFSIPKQTSSYDKEHRFIRLWVEEMKYVSREQLTRRLTKGCRARPKYSGKDRKHNGKDRKRGKRNQYVRR